MIPTVDNCADVGGGDHNRQTLEIFVLGCVFPIWQLYGIGEMDPISLQTIKNKEVNQRNRVFTFRRSVVLPYRC